MNLGSKKFNQDSGHKKSSLFSRIFLRCFPTERLRTTPKHSFDCVQSTAVSEKKAIFIQDITNERNPMDRNTNSNPLSLLGKLKKLPCKTENSLPVASNAVCSHESCQNEIPSPYIRRHIQTLQCISSRQYPKGMYVVPCRTLSSISRCSTRRGSNKT